MSVLVSSFLAAGWDLSFFTVGSFSFWALTFAALIALSLFVEWGDRGWSITTTVLVYLGLIHIFGDANLVSWGINHWILSLVGVGLYFVCSIFWCVGKWKFFVSNKAQEIKEQYTAHKCAFLSKSKSKALNEPSYALYQNPELMQVLVSDNAKIPSVLAPEWREFIRVEASLLDPPRPSQHKSRIIGWMALWPLSFALTMLRDPLHAFFQMVYTNISEQLQNISERAFAPLRELYQNDFGGLEEEEEEEEELREVVDIGGDSGDSGDSEVSENSGNGNSGDSDKSDS